jgi:hypothetical protein
MVSVKGAIIMKYGLHLPNFGSFSDPRILINLAKEAENAGWDGFFLWDHLLFCELDKNPHADPWIVLSAIATQTTKINIGTIVTPLARRRPWKLARETVTLQNLSNGRLILGVGLGDPVEWEFGFFHDDTDPKIRAQKLDEGLDILIGLWTGEPFKFSGIHYQLEEMTFLPTPVQPIPIWVGGYWPRKPPFRRAARYNGISPGALEGTLSPKDWNEINVYIQQHRTNESHFDLVGGGQTPAEPAEAKAIIEPYAQVGITWWLEDISPLRLGMGWDELWKPWDVEALRQRILAGPPTT